MKKPVSTNEGPLAGGEPRGEPGSLLSREWLPAAAPFQPGPLWPDAEVLCWEARNAHLRQPSLPPHAGDAFSKNREVERDIVTSSCSPSFTKQHGIPGRQVDLLCFLILEPFPPPLSTPRDTRSSEFTPTRVVSAVSACWSTQRPLKPVQRATWVLFSMQRLQTQMPAMAMQGP